MKNLELSQMENLEGGCFSCAPSCTNQGNGFTLGAATAGAVVGGPVGFLVGGLIGIIGGTLINGSNCAVE